MNSLGRAEISTLFSLRDTIHGTKGGLTYSYMETAILICVGSNLAPPSYLFQVGDIPQDAVLAVLVITVRIEGVLAIEIRRVAAA